MKKQLVLLTLMFTSHVWAVDKEENTQLLVSVVTQQEKYIQVKQEEDLEKLDESYYSAVMLNSSGTIKDFSSVLENYDNYSKVWYSSGSFGSICESLEKKHAKLIDLIYSHNTDGAQGIFNTKLNQFYHTEPKASNEHLMLQSTPLFKSSILLVSKFDLCQKCVKLLSGIFLKSADEFFKASINNILAISIRSNYYKNDEKLKFLVKNHHESLNKNSEYKNIKKNQNILFVFHNMITADDIFSENDFSELSELSSQVKDTNFQKQYEENKKGEI